MTDNDARTRARAPGSIFFRLKTRVFLAAWLVSGAALTATGAETYLSPAAIETTADGRTAFVACATANRILRVDLEGRNVAATISIKGVPTGVTLSPDETVLFVTCAGMPGRVLAVDPASGKVKWSVEVGHTAMAPVTSPDGKILYVCNRFGGDVSFIDVGARKEIGRVKVKREPVAAAVTPDGRALLVANLLHAGSAQDAVVSAVISVIDAATAKVSKELVLPNGSGVVRGIAVSPDGKYAFATHVLSRFNFPTTQLDRGWMNTAAGSIVDLARMELANTVLLDSVDSGAADPWGVAWSADSGTVVVTHAGTHEVSVIDFRALLAKMAALPARTEEVRNPDPNLASHVQADVPNDLSFLAGLRRRWKLPATEKGPRCVAVTGAGRIVAGNYFTDSLALADIGVADECWESLPLGPNREMTAVRRGEFYFHDAGICFQGWQSCATCHPGEARTDALNWDLLNDGIGNPKNTKSMLLSHRTPPAMSTGVRETAEVAVRSGIRHILFTVQPDEVGSSLDEYLKSLTPLPSPRLVKGGLSKQAARGRKLFAKAGCAECHPAGLFTDLKQYDVGTQGIYDREIREFDTPTLVETWRTGPYLHDGSATTMLEVLTKHNKRDQHGKTSNLSRDQLDDLVAYILSL